MVLIDRPHAYEHRCLHFLLCVHATSLHCQVECTSIVQASAPSDGAVASMSSSKTEVTSAGSSIEQDADEISSIVEAEQSRRRRVRPDLVEEKVQRTRWDGSVTQAIKKIYRRAEWTYAP